MRWRPMRAWASRCSQRLRLQPRSRRAVVGGCSSSAGSSPSGSASVSCELSVSCTVPPGGLRHNRFAKRHGQSPSWSPFPSRSRCSAAEPDGFETMSASFPGCWPLLRPARASVSCGYGSRCTCPHRTFRGRLSFQARWCLRSAWKRCNSSPSITWPRGSRASPSFTAPLGSPPRCSSSSSWSAVALSGAQSSMPWCWELRSRGRH